MADSSQAKNDGCRCILLLLEKDPVSQNHCAVECEARFRADPCCADRSLM
jgi:hypothetical protein